MNRPRGTARFDNSGRVVIVTGGAGGIGQAICTGFAESGAEVVCLDMTAPEPGTFSDRVIFRQVDVTDEDQCAGLIQETVERCGGLDVLVNNAAIQPVSSFVPLHQLDSQLWRKSLEVNISGYTYMAKHAIPQMMKQKSGVILNMASAQAHRTARDVPAYGPTKAANVLQAMQWAIEYARYGIRVVSISPGAINTPLVRASLEKQGGERELANRHPLGRIGEPHEIAAAALWLASPAASFVTATDIAVDGGLGGYASFADPYPYETDA
jgi:NAD(P)-dependent dehydrogenase (short-subunit alcohol dehydrogenase family)